ncbi:MAG TPA: hypothetical protein PLD88_06560, partial [Candidatus Berkiella sp.]|nr:hypothetical protein [Candidatus Berkiella sp.]
ATKMQMGQYSLENISLRLHGTLAKHEAIMNAKIDGYPVKSALCGELTPKKWIAKLNEIVVEHERWQQMGTTNGILTLNWDKKYLKASIDALLWNKYPLSVQLKTLKAKPYTLSGTI